MAKLLYTGPDIVRNRLEITLVGLLWTETGFYLVRVVFGVSIDDIAALYSVKMRWPDSNYTNYVSIFWEIS
jgi:hypothetical protein